MPKSVWTPEDVATLRKLWEDGLTAAAIADALPDYINRGGVIGKAHRLGLPRRDSVIATGLPDGVARKLSLRLQKLGLSKGSNAAIMEAFAFTWDGTPSQIAWALGLPLARVEAALKAACRDLGPQAI